MLLRGGRRRASSYTPPEYTTEAMMAIAIDPVCGMEVDTATSDLSFEFEGTTYWFCGRGCLLEFKDDPKRYLSPDHQPSM
jgi:YHS domain-containing protein